MFIQVGYGNFAAKDRVVAIVRSDAAPIRRVIKEARDRGMLIDSTNGRKTKAVIITESDHIILSATYPETIVKRVDPKEVEECSCIYRTKMEGI